MVKQAFLLCVDGQGESEPAPQLESLTWLAFLPPYPVTKNRKVIAIFALNLFLLHSFIHLCACFRRHVSHGALVELRITCGSYFSPSVM